MLRALTCTIFALVAGGCVANLGPADEAASRGPVLGTWFDCVRERGGVVITAHRALSSDDQPENSIEAIEATGKAIPGAMVEIDARLTHDGRLILMHDGTLQRTTTDRGAVADMNFADVRLARLRAKNGRVTAAPPPTLAEALDAARRVGVIVVIDLKPVDEATTLSLAGAVIDEVRARSAADRVVLITYSPEMARAIAALAPEIMISAVLHDMAGLDGLNLAQVLAWTSTPDTALRQALAARGVEAQVGTLGAPGTRLDDLYASDGDPSEYRVLHAQGALVIATDTPLAVRSAVGPELAAAQTCRR